MPQFKNRHCFAVSHSLFFCTALFFFSSAVVQAAPHLDVSIQPDKIHSQETAVLKIQIEWPQTDPAYVFALPQLRLKNLSLVRQGESRETFAQEKDLWVRKTFTMELKAEQSGQGIIEGFAIPYLDGLGQKAGEFSVSQLQVQVMRPPLPVKKMAAFAAGVLSFFVVGGIWGVRRKKASLKSEIPSLKDNTLAKIYSIQKDFRGEKAVTEISAEFRRFLIDYYQLLCKQATEAEILEALKSADLISEELATLRDILGRIREAKFIGGQLSSFDCEHLEKDMINFIQSKKNSNQVIQTK